MISSKFYYANIHSNQNHGGSKHEFAAFTKKVHHKSSYTPRTSFGIFPKWDTVIINDI